jgi:hypothetical protein
MLGVVVYWLLNPFFPIWIGFKVFDEAFVVHGLVGALKRIDGAGILVVLPVYLSVCVSEPLSVCHCCLNIL